MHKSTTNKHRLVIMEFCFSVIEYKLEYTTWWIIRLGLHASASYSAKLSPSLAFLYTPHLWPLKSRMLHKIIPISRWLINKPSLHLLTVRLPSQLGLLVTYHSLNGVSWSKSTSPLIKKSRLKTKYSAVRTNKLLDQNYRFILSLYLGYNVTLNVLQ